MPTGTIVGEEKIAEGKTKILYSYNGPGHEGCGRMVAKDDLTAGDGARRDSFPGKGKLAARTNRHVMELLRSSNIPVAHHKSLGDTEDLVTLCTMLPYEVVMLRQVAEASSARKRDPELKTGTRFDALKVLFFLKTTGPIFKGHAVPKDDPLISRISPEGLWVRHPQQPSEMNPHSVHIPAQAIWGESPHPYKKMEEIGRRVFLVLENAWVQCAYTLLDLKIEFGIDPMGNLVVADVITNDEWRLLDHSGQHRDKQLFRDKKPMEVIIEAYEEVAALSEQFLGYSSDQTIILWLGSEKDRELCKRFEDELARLGNPACLETVVCSMHKQTHRGLDELRYIERDYPDSVFIAHLDFSNGIGPMLAGNTTLPVIAVPVDEKDIWSSLRLPSDLPMMTVLRPENAIQAAVGIFALHSPHAHMALRYVRESYWLDETNSPTLKMSF